jgi:hypothetical protein
MFIELVDHLRCVRPHEETWLVAAARRMEGRHIVEGMLGCPICRAEYAVRDGVADFRAGRGETVDGTGGHAPPPDESEVMRAGALLGLDEPGGVVLLAGTWGAIAPALAEMADVQLLLLDPPTGVESADRISVVRADPPAAPFAGGFLRAAAVDAGDGGAAGALRVEAAARALRGGGRLLAPVGAAVPSGIVELARDERHWLGEREAGVSQPVRLGIVRRP